MKKGEKTFTLILLGVSVLFIVGSFFLVPVSRLTVSSPGGYPIFVSVLCLLFALMVVFGEKPEQDTGETGRLFDPVIVAFIVLLALYVLGILYLHYTVATLLFLFAAVLYLRRGSWKQAVLVSYISTFLILLVFKYIFNVILP